MNASESAGHRELKRLALAWAQSQGYRIAAAEITLPNMRFRLDVAGYRPQRISRTKTDPHAARQQESIGVTAVFECKVSRTDFRRDACSLLATAERLKTLYERKARIEQELRLHYPSICNVDSLFQEYHSVDFERPGYERYQQALTEVRRLTSRLYTNTKFDRLVKWNASNLFYVVAEAGAALPHELPACWGLLVRDGGSLRVAIKPILREISEAERLSLLHRIALAATRAVNHEHGVSWNDVQEAC